MKFGNVLMLATLGSVVLISACGGGGGGSSNSSNTGRVQLSGTINASSGQYQVAAKPSTLFFARVLSYFGFASSAIAGVGDPAVDKVVAIPMISGSLTSWGAENKKESAISANGTFTLTLETDRDWLLMLINSSATGTARFVGSVAFDVGSSNSMLNLPVTETTTSSLELGTVSRATATTKDALTSKVVSTADFTLSATQLTTMAKTDKLFRNGMNIVNNYGNFGNGPTIWYAIRPDFAFGGVFSTLTTTFSSPSLTYEGMNVQFDTNDTAVTMNMICNNTVSVKFVPPAPVSIPPNAYDQNTPITNGSGGCSPSNGGSNHVNGSFFAGDNTEGRVSYSIMGAITPNPPGFWLWKVDNVTKGAFDIGSTTPPVTAAGKLRGFVPSFKINVNGSNRITSVDIKWYYYDEALDAYTPLHPADLKVLNHFIEKLEVKFDRTYNSVRRSEGMILSASTTTTVVPTGEWYADKHPADPLMETGLMGFFQSGGYGHFFNFRNTNMTP